MNRLQVVPGGERVGKSPVSSSALRVNGDRPGSVRRRRGRHLARFYRAVDWGYLRFVLAWGATVFVLVYVAAGRMQ